MTERANGVIVNRLPSLTWNRLRVNHAFVNFDELPETNEEAVFTGQHEDQVKKETMTSAHAERWADGFSRGIRREAYIAGKQATYQEQHFATALGRDFTDLIRDLALETAVYTVEEGSKLDKPVILNWDFGKGGRAAAQQVIYARKGSEATFLLNLSSERDALGHAAIETKVIIEEGAALHLMKTNLLGRGFVLLDDSAAVVGDHAEFDFVQVELGGAKTYTGCYADQCGDHSLFKVQTGYLADRDHLMDINYVAVQRGKKTDSRISVKGSLRDQATKVFRGTIDFRKGAKGSVGDEQEDVLILDPKVTNKTVPVVLTEEEDVDGRHGATLGNLSPDILFYLGSRGIDKDAAEMLMTRGRLMSVVNLIPDEETVARSHHFIREAFEANE